ncbi:MAG: S8 family peptidase, partial [Candidatus Bathyarchaeota archaeon]
MKSKVGINVVLLSLLLVISSLAIVITPVCANKTEVEVIIGFINKSQVGQAVLNSGGRVNQIYTIIPAMFANIPENALEALQRNPNVRYIEPNSEVFALQTIPWGIDRVFGAENYPFPTWSSSSGSGVTVAVLDTGIANHEDLNVVGGYNAIDNTKPWIDGYGHGTHVAGTIAALDNLVGVVGVAPDVGLYAVKVLDDSGSGTLDNVIEGIQWSVANDIDIISMSLGSSTYSISLDGACSNAYTSGSLLVASAGNSGNPAGRGDNVGYPAKYDSVIAVAATDQNDKRARFSSTGPAVELAAPGVDILSTYPGGYATGSGTSMACP